MTTKRHLRDDEIATLRATGCSAEDWSRITVPTHFDPSRIERTRFSGDVELGVLEGEFALEGGVVRRSAILGAALHNCRVGDGVLIDGVKCYIANYDIGPGCRIENVGIIVCDGVCRFGAGVEVAVLCETGGREVPIYDRLSASLAYIIAMYRHRAGLITRLNEMIGQYAREGSSQRGTIGQGATITGTGTIRGVIIGPHTIIENATRLENGSINSTPDAPVRIGDSVIAEDFIVSSGATVADAAKIVRCFVGQGCHVSVNYMAHDSLIFSNCTLENGEGCAIFAGPFTVSMHKSSLLIAGMFSFLNAGSGSNQSNHMYKLGPIHQGVVERGSKTTSDSYILWPARVGAFSLVMGRHHGHCDTRDMPFSYLIEKDDETWLVPGVNLRSVGTVRDAQKWPRRDRRMGPDRLDMINYNLLSPYTVGRMKRAVETLGELQNVSGATSGVYSWHGTRIEGRALVRALDYYDMAIRKFMGNSLIKRLEGEAFASISEVRARLAPTSEEGRGEWIDLAGLIVPRQALDGLIGDIEAGQVTLESIEGWFRTMHSRYYDMEWTWVWDVWEAYYGVRLAEITAAQIVDVVRGWQRAVTTIDEMLYDDARKEFSLTAMTGFGVDGSKGDQQADFRGVRGDFETNSFVVAVKEHIAAKQDLGEELIARIGVLLDR